MTTVEPGGDNLTQVRRVVTTIPGPRSKEIHQRKAASVPDGVGQTLPVYITAAGGGIVRDIDGNQLIDFGSGIAVVNAGNANPDVVSRVQEQVASFTHTCFMVTPYEGYVEVAEALNRLTPGDHDKKTALFNSGAEAVENAVKIARSATGRDAVVVFDHAYHGRTNLTMAMTAKNMPYKKGFGPFASEVYRAPMSYPLHDDEAAGTKVSGVDAARRAISQIEKQVGADELAGIVIEPIQGEGGFIVPARGFLPELRKWCEANGVKFIADEVQTGFARTGQMFACEDEDVVPDLMTTAKGIGGGLPLSAVTGRSEVMDAVHGGGLGGTFGGNPVACAAALGAIETYERDDLPAKAQHIGDIMVGELTTIRAKHSAIADIRGRGAMIAIEVTKPGTLQPDPDLTAAVAAEAHANGLVVLVTGTYSNILRFLPPLVMPEDLLYEGLRILADAFDTIDK